ncbi:MAG: hypothetical protein DRN81_04400 [Thermoproteota archaeon]|nr:MAG: hypothetical protein DRN81_04400 [Candidatus Korarchaeota archaeon]
MRFIYVVLLGLIIFNGVIIAMSPFFPASLDTDEHAVDIRGNETIGAYNTLSPSLFSNIWLQALSVAGAVFIGAIVIAVLSQQYALFIGIGGFIAIVSGLWSVTNGIILKMSNSIYVNTLLQIIIICIGIIAVFSMVEMLNSQRGAD